MIKKNGPVMDSLGKILAGFNWDERKYISQEFQDYGYRLAEQLGDLSHKALYMRLAKTEPRARLTEALCFVKEAYQVKNPAKLFMWKLHQLKERGEEKKKE